MNLQSENWLTQIEVILQQKTVYSSLMHELKRSRAVVRKAAEELTEALVTRFPSKIRIENRKIKINKK